MSGLGALAAGFGTGYMAMEANQRAASKEKRDQEAHDVSQQVRKIGLGRLEAEEPVVAKELQVRGAMADFNQTEQEFRNAQQPQEQRTRRIQAGTAETTAQTAAADATANAALQPAQAEIKAGEVGNNLIDTHLRQSSNVWRAFKNGDKNTALKMVNGSSIIAPGREFSDMKLEDVDVDSPNGGTQKVPTLTLIPKEEGGKPVRISVQRLNSLEQQFGAQYKVVDKALVRVNRDGSVTPLYEGDQYMAVPEGSTVASRRTGTPPAAGGINPAPPGPSSRATARVDERVKMAIDKVILPKYGGKFEGGVFFPDDANKDVALRATTLAGELVRKGVDPEAAGSQAIAQAEREKALKDAAGKDAGGGGGGYGGPTPWRK